MSDVPIAKSFFKASALAQWVARLYGLSDVRCQLLSATMRDAYRVTAREGDYLLLVYRHGPRTREHIAAEWQFVKYLAVHGVPVAPAIPTLAADYVIPLNAPEGARYAVLSSFVTGQHLRRRPTVRAVATYGFLIATIHQRADAMPFSVERPANDVEVLLENSIAAAEQAIADRPSDLAYLRDCVHFLRTLRIALPKKPPFYGLIHGDAIRANAQVADDGNVTVLDFDFCGPGWRAYDVASYLITIRGDPVARATRLASSRARPAWRWTATATSG
jgi:Ser/Thr protein kinase RdoA (MazF antagonist)